MVIFGKPKNAHFMDKTTTALDQTTVPQNVLRDGKIKEFYAKDQKDLEISSFSLTQKMIMNDCLIYQ